MLATVNFFDAANQGGPVISTALTTTFVVITAVLWWKLRAARGQNVLLRAEVTQLRRRLYNLLP